MEGLQFSSPLMQEMEGVPKLGGESAHPQGEAVDRKALTLPDSSSYVESA